VAATRLIEIDVDQLEPDPDNVRTAYDPEVIRGLADFFRDQGTFIENPVVWKAGKLPDGRTLYRAFSGSTRAQAARRVGGKITVQVLPEAPEGSGKLLGQLAAGLVKGELDPLDISRTLVGLQKDGRSVQDLVRELADWGIRRSRSWVFQHLHLADLVPELQEMVRSGQLPVTAVNALYAKPPEEQRRLAQRIAEGGFHPSKLESTEAPADGIQQELDERISQAALGDEPRGRGGRRGARGEQRHGAVQTRRLLLGVDSPDQVAQLSGTRTSRPRQLPPEDWAAQAGEEERALAREALHLGKLSPEQAIEAVKQWQHEAELAPDDLLMATHGMKRLIDAYTRNPESVANYPGLMGLVQLRAAALAQVAELVQRRHK